MSCTVEAFECILVAQCVTPPRCHGRRLLPIRSWAVRLHQLRQPWRLLSRVGRSNILHSMPNELPTISRSAQRGGQTCVPVQGRCDILVPPVRGGSFALGFCACRFQRALPPQGTTTRDSRPARFVTLAIDRFRALPWNTACLWVCRRVRNVRGRKGLRRLLRRRPHALCLPCVKLAMCSRAGPVGVSCPGRLSPPFRDSGSASPFLCLARTLLGQTFDQITRRLQRFGWRFCYRPLTHGLS